jgi:hypothetical protein
MDEWNQASGLQNGLPIYGFISTKRKTSRSVRDTVRQGCRNTDDSLQCDTELHNKKIKNPRLGVPLTNNTSMAFICPLPCSSMKTCTVQPGKRSGYTWRKSAVLSGDGSCEERGPWAVLLSCNVIVIPTILSRESVITYMQKWSKHASVSVSRPLRLATEFRISAKQIATRPIWQITVKQSRRALRVNSRPSVIALPIYIDILFILICIYLRIPKILYWTDRKNV